MPSQQNKSTIPIEVQNEILDMLKEIEMSQSKTLDHTHDQIESCRGSSSSQLFQTQIQSIQQAPNQLQNSHCCLDQEISQHVLSFQLHD